ncbi:MAG: 23S rRNA (adenine(2503)-C(2))-methyltransferase RlmN [Anaerovibrio sp.]|uniref:23S rRNA (adenine(2503)-C(2))-methyltransferase RlmN n=1 Tax=Anaerovibrio sp. TaxID=1872532 RepID=UPI0025F3CBCC|nr:23S rRNA (adenine(2503)-C(2))-methyltransferase RlmN [Anaerovibrio sp.]MCR5177314.1 23S rRNA (adenine(2503)-C(2))-methyltransferase RlmN [Anaerovibrio sp.]
MINIFGQTLPEMTEMLMEWGFPKFRGKQLADWMYGRSVTDFSVMNNLPLKMREKLAAECVIDRALRVDQMDSSDGRTSKFLLNFSDGVGVETVLMRQPYGNSICVSSQAGCNMGCAFCASTLHGMVRNLTAGEMLAQTYYINDLLKQEGAKVDTIVIMGSGEPLTNYDNVLKYMRLMHEDYCLGMGYRNITLSTSGIVPNIYRLAEEGLPINLSISLHAPEDALRSELMPINRKYPMAEVVKAGAAYGNLTHRRVTYEYILIDGVNDNIKQAEELTDLLKGQLASVNLIPINPVVERNWNRPSLKRIGSFEKYLMQHNITVTVRREMGNDIQAACGQLRNRHIEEN